jgi:hypothetical protein
LRMSPPKRVNVTAGEAAGQGGGPGAGGRRPGSGIGYQSGRFPQAVWDAG